MRKNIITLLSVLALTGCVATELSTQDKAYDKSQDARIRLYGQNQKASLMEVEINGNTEKITVGGGFGQALGSMLRLKGNESIGMPSTEFSKNPSAHSHLLSGIFFKEFVIPAGKKVKVTNAYIPLTNKSEAVFGNVKSTVIIKEAGCAGNVITFEPEAGKDYEVVPINSGKDCGVSIYEIH